MELGDVDNVKGKLVKGDEIITDVNKRQIVDNVEAEDKSRKTEELCSEDAAKLTQFMPEEVWQLVSRKLKKNDLVNLVNSSLYFWQLRRTDRIYFLFPMVFQIMTLLFENRKLQMKISTKSEEDTSQEHLMERLVDDDEKREAKEATISVKLWRSTVFNCRLVCFTWNKAVENCYESAEIKGIKEFVKDLDPRSPLNTMYIEMFGQKFSFCNQGQVVTSEKFLENFETSHGSSLFKNPFFGRSVFIETHLVEEQNEQYFNSLIKILELFGGYIGYCELTVSPQQVILDLKRILKLMPNLKYLRLISNVRYPPRKEYVPVNLPTLKNLQVLSLEYLELPAATEIIRANSHVNFLSFYCCEVDENVGSVLTNLKGYSTSNSVGGDGILVRFGNEWKLNHVKICPRYDQGALQLFSILENSWKEMLTDVNLEHPFTGDVDSVYEQSKRSLLNLPCLRRLSILSEHVFFLEFLEPLNKNLEHLEIYPKSFYEGAKYWERVKCDQKIEWVGFKEEMNRSNIWNLFGKLKTIKIKYGHWGVSRRSEMVFTDEGQKLVYCMKQN